MISILPGATSGIRATGLPRRWLAVQLRMVRAYWIARLWIARFTKKKKHRPK